MSQVTKKALEQSLKNLLLKKPLNKITVSDITNECGINRMTFYYHFKDIRDLIEWSFLEDAQNFRKSHETTESWQEGLIAFFRESQNNRDLILNLYHSVDRERVEIYLYSLLDPILLQYVEEQAKGMVLREEDKHFIARIFAYIFIGLVLDWIKNGMKDDPEPLVEKLSIAIQGTFHSTLNNFRIDSASKNEN